MSVKSSFEIHTHWWGRSAKVPVGALSEMPAAYEKEDLQDEEALQGWFNTRIENYLAAKGKQIIGWDEILEGGLSPNATVQSWRGFEGAQHAAEQGHDAIVSPTSHAYFDYPVSSIDVPRSTISIYILRIGPIHPRSPHHWW